MRLRSYSLVRRVGFLAIAILAVILLVACGDTAEQNTKATVNNQQNIYNNNQPIHTYQWSLERQIVQQLYDYRIQKAVDTWSVWVADGTGEPIDICPSKGFPIPYNTSLTNPQQAYGSTTIALAEPNGLYPGGSTSATWVMCVESDGTVHPQYIEPNVMTYTYPIKIVTDNSGKRHIERSGNPDPSTRLNLDQSIPSK